jgi:T5SS/PEP-CTERM-associated repeat protein
MNLGMRNVWGNRLVTPLLVVGLFSAGGAAAADYDWLNSGPTDPDFEDSLNWTLGIVPGASDKAIFDGADSEVWFQSDVSNKAAIFRDGEFSLDLNANTWTLTGFPALTVGESLGDNAVLNISDGLIATDSLSYVGLAAGSTGTINVGAGGTLNTFLNLGVDGHGELNVTDGGRVYGPTSGNLSFLWAAKGDNSSAEINVDGAGSIVQLTGFSATSIADVHLANGVNSTTDLNISNDGYFSSNAITVGHGAGSTATVNADSGGTLRTNNNMYIGYGNGSTGTVTASGADTVVDVDRLHVGYDGVGELNILAGATLLMNRASIRSLDEIGSLAGSQGTVNIDGAGSTWSINHDINVGSNGTGTINVSNGAEVNLTSNTFVGRYGGSSGYITVDNAVANIATGTDENGQDTRFFIGLLGDGHLEVRNGGTLTTGSGEIGYVDTPTGSSAMVTGAGSTWTARNISVSNGSTLTINDGGVVSSVASGLNRATGAANRLYLDGAGSRWDVSGNFSNYGEARVTSGAVLDVSQTLSLNSDSLMVVDAATVNIGGNVDSRGSLTVDIRNGGQFTTAGTYTTDGSSHVSVSSGSVLTVANTYNMNGGDASLTVNNATVNAGSIGLNAADTSLNVEGNGGAAVASSITGVVTNNASVNVRDNAIANFNSDFINNATTHVEDGSTAIFAGSVSGAGDFTGTGLLVFESVLAPGNSPALLSIEGDIEFAAGSTFEAELAGSVIGSGYDSISVGGSASLAGMLDLTLIDGFEVSLGDYFVLLSAEEIIGEFDTYVLPELTGVGWRWETTYILSDSGTDRLRITAVPIPAAVWLFGSGLAMLGWFRRRRRA